MTREVKVFRIRGLMKYRTGDVQPFTIEVTALSEGQALEKVYSLLGSRHKLKRRNIKIQSIEEVSIEDVKSDYVRRLLELDRLVVI